MCSLPTARLFSKADSKQTRDWNMPCRLYYVCRLYLLIQLTITKDLTSNKQNCALLFFANWTPPVDMEEKLLTFKNSFYNHFKYQGEHEEWSVFIRKRNLLQLNCATNQNAWHLRTFQNSQSSWLVITLDCESKSLLPSGFF